VVTLNTLKLCSTTYFKANDWADHYRKCPIVWICEAHTLAVFTCQPVMSIEKVLTFPHAEGILFPSSLASCASITSIYDAVFTIHSLHHSLTYFHQTFVSYQTWNFKHPQLSPVINLQLSDNCEETDLVSSGPDVCLLQVFAVMSHNLQFQLFGLLR